MLRERRLVSDYREVVDDVTQCLLGVQVDVVGDNLSVLHVKLPGPADTPYVGGTYELRVVLPVNYPLVPPEIWFNTRIWHPNICSQFGRMCVFDEW
jgi:ubiquitin-protein ligase